MRQYRATRGYLLACGLLLLLATCDTLSPKESDRSITLTALDVAGLSVNSLDIRLDSSGAVSGIRNSVSTRGIIWDAGVWLAGLQDGKARASIRVLSQSNYRARGEGQPLGVFVLTRDSLEGTRITNWPTQYGAPVRGDGKPLIFGDMMLWSALVPGVEADVGYEPESLFNSPLTGVYISQAVYGYSAPDLRDIVFLQYEFTNHSAEPFDELYAGFFADVDLERVGCFSLAANATGYDIDRALSYTYPRDAAGDEDLGCPVRVLGLAILESPVASEPPQSVTSHSIFRKNVADYDFSEATLRTPEDVLYRLQGLSSAGEPMIDPETGSPTKFAFTGDPIREIGWLDESIDVRSLTASGPFRLAIGQTKRIVVAIVVAEGSVLSEALTSLKQKVDRVMDRTELWRPTGTRAS